MAGWRTIRHAHAPKISPTRAASTGGTCAHTARPIARRGANGDGAPRRRGDHPKHLARRGRAAHRRPHPRGVLGSRRVDDLRGIVHLGQRAHVSDDRYPDSTPSFGRRRTHAQISPQRSGCSAGSSNGPESPTAARESPVTTRTRGPSRPSRRPGAAGGDCRSRRAFARRSTWKKGGLERDYAL